MIGVSSFVGTLAGAAVGAVGAMVGAWYQQRRTARFTLDLLRIEREQDTALRIDEELSRVESAAKDYLENYAGSKDTVPASFLNWFDPARDLQWRWDYRAKRRIRSPSLGRAFENAQLGRKAQALKEAQQDPERFASVVGEVEKVVADLRHEIQVLLKEDKPKKRK